MTLVVVFMTLGKRVQHHGLLDEHIPTLIT
jgi:hypothetical protein